MIRNILEHDDYKNITGLHKALNQYLTQQDEQVAAEDLKLRQEETEVATESNTLNTYPCACVWGEWEDWGECSVTCGGGEKTRLRIVVKEAMNGGPECEGSTSHTTSCGSDPCGKKFIPINLIVFVISRIA